jgi:hypothetical protein
MCDYPGKNSSENPVSNISKGKCDVKGPLPNQVEIAQFRVWFITNKVQLANLPVAFGNNFNCKLNVGQPKFRNYATLVCLFSKPYNSRSAS